MSLFWPIEEMNFGSELFDRMELCSMMKLKRPDGSYFVEHESEKDIMWVQFHIGIQC